jgi:hypothetical protein
MPRSGDKQRAQHHQRGVGRILPGCFCRNEAVAVVHLYPPWKYVGLNQADEYGHAERHYECLETLAFFATDSRESIFGFSISHTLCDTEPALI